MAIKNRQSWPKQRGPISQRELVRLLPKLIEAAKAPNSTAHRDIARSELREVLDTANWRTPFVMKYIASGRCRFIASLGYAVPYQYLKEPWHGKKEPLAEEEA